MRRLGEQIEPPQTFQYVLSTTYGRVFGVGDDHADVSSLCMDVAADVDDGLGTECQQLVYKLDVAPLARWIDDDGCPVSWKVVYGCKDVGCVAGHKGALVGWNVVELCVCGCGADSFWGDLDAGDGVKVWGEEDGEEAGSTVGVDEVGGACICGQDGVADIVGEGDEDGIVILEKGVTGELEIGVSDAFAYGFLVICDADVVGRIVWGCVCGVDGDGGVE